VRRLAEVESVVRDLSPRSTSSPRCRTPVERITQRSILAGSGDNSCRRIAEALQVKDEILKAKRTECQALWP